MCGVLMSPLLQTTVTMERIFTVRLAKLLLGTVDTLGTSACGSDGVFTIARSSLWYVQS
jgi:hypothetical protein